MMRVISPEELQRLTGEAPAPAPAKKSTIEIVLEILNNPVVQNLLNNLLSRFLPSRSVQAEAPKFQLEPEIIFNSIMSFLSVLPEEMTLKEVKAELMKNKEQFIGVLRNVFRI